jgi:hypothetical protein
LELFCGEIKNKLLTLNNLNLVFQLLVIDKTKLNFSLKSLIMKTESIIPERKGIASSLLLLFLLFSYNLKAQKGIEIALSAYPGYTAVNFEKALGYSDDYMNDWDQFYYSVSLKGFLTSDRPFSYGAEIGWQRLYYAYYIIPYGPLPAYREFNVTTTSVMALARYCANKQFYALFGAGIHIFNDGLSPAIFIEPGYMISLGENLKIPVSVRINPVFGDGVPTPVSLGIGLSYRLR